MIRRARYAIQVVVLVVRSCNWKATAASKFKVPPRYGEPVSSWRTAYVAFDDVRPDLRGVVRTVRMAIKEDSQVQFVRQAMSSGKQEAAGAGEVPSVGAIEGPLGTEKAEATRSARNRIAA